MFSSVVLPTPFGPTSATRSPRPIRTEKSLSTTRSPKRLPTCPASTTSFPDSGPPSNPSRAVPARSVASRRSARSSASRRTRPMLRLRRAEIPSTAQRPSAFRNRSSLCRAASSSSQVLSRQASNAAKPRSSRRTSPRSTQSVRSVRFFRNARSWLTTTNPVRPAARCASSQAIAWTSRWLVGSSSSISSGASAISFASAARRRSPPDARSGASIGSSFSPSIAAATRHSSPTPSPCPANAPSVAKPAKSGSCAM